MHPAVFDGVTNREERNGGAYSKTKRLTISSTKILPPKSALRAPLKPDGRTHMEKYTAESLA
jgi:hypothetical protein